MMVSIFWHKFPHKGTSYGDGRYLVTLMGRRHPVFFATKIGEEWVLDNGLKCTGRIAALSIVPTAYKAWKIK